MKKVDAKLYDKKYFDETCGGYALWQKYKGKILEPRHEQAMVLADLKRGMQILDYGCGRGEIVMHAAKIVKKAIGIDYSQDAIKIAKETQKSFSPEIQTKTQFFIDEENILQKLCRDNSMDVIFFLDVIEHLYSEQNEAVMKEFFRILKPGGKIIVHTWPNKNYYEKGYKYYVRPIWLILSYPIKILFNEQLTTASDPRKEIEKLVHINEQTPEAIRALLMKNNFQTKIWLDDGREKRNWLNYLSSVVVKPSWLPIVGNHFLPYIWAIGTKP